MDDARHVEGLLARHRELESALRSESAAVYPDNDELRRLKREKLQVRDRIEALHRKKT